jgi:hypothetical protein
VSIAGLHVTGNLLALKSEKTEGDPP